MDLVKKSIEVIKDLQLDNGGILATPLDGAYPYVYPRDGVIMTKALNAVGLAKRSEKFYYFINKYAKIDFYREIFHRYNANGYPCVTRKHEHDCVGLVLHGIYDTFLHTKKEMFLETMWPLILEGVNLIFSYSRTGLVHTERSIHELYRLENGYEIWANCACCRGLYDAAKIAEVLGHRKEAKKWHNKAKQIEQNIKQKMFNRKFGVFVKNIKYPNTPDIAQLSPFYFNLVDSKTILKNTMDFLRKHIWYKEIGGFRRFRKFEICKDWHWYTGGSGSWVAFTIWGAKFYRQLKKEKFYKECVDWVHKATSRTNGLLPEHISTREEYEAWKMHEIEFNYRILRGMEKAEKLAKRFKEDIIYWAIPLGWSHAEYILLKKED